ncbi:hypothetical protein N7517_005593 [Penicillium concentricum]|uniref:Uncharacterized protein n=1 Tax=Penicillium concentricum TaxID=293559 RepID=A0A9W9V9C4_9EURO|nr:uncharacterized protein N7517_005593 [Penicillium concentricum]KAJ5373587.1 hypothetical protein N7517_005593 [Penicillium concentricum]
MFSSNADSLGSSEACSWVKSPRSAEDPPFAVISTLHTVGQLVLGWLRHKHKLVQIRAEKEAKCTEAESRSRQLELRAMDAELSALEAHSHAEQLAQQLREAKQQAAEFQRRAVEAEERAGDWRNSGFSNPRVESLNGPQSPVQSEGSSYSSSPSPNEAQVSFGDGWAHFPDGLTKRA